jgi:glycosyltransferase involved in cell wall biosynthesis
VRRLAITSRVRFLGKINEIVPLLSVSDLMLMPSNAESFGLAALEAMACGVPVIGTDVGGFPEFIEDGRHGYLCRPGDVAAMTERAKRLLSDSAMWAAFSDACVLQARRYETALMVDRYETFYRELLAEGKRKSP